MLYLTHALGHRHRNLDFGFSRTRPPGREGHAMKLFFEFMAAMDRHIERERQAKRQKEKESEKQNARSTEDDR